MKPLETKHEFGEPDVTLLTLNLLITNLPRFLRGPGHLHTHSRLEVQLNQLVPPHCRVHLLLLVVQDYTIRG